jgi:hypothetical protein
MQSAKCRISIVEQCFPRAPHLTRFQTPGAGLRWNHACRRTAFSQLNSCFALRLSTSTLHEPATAASNHSRAPARTESLRLSSPRMPCQPSLQPLPAASKPTISRCNYRPLPPTSTLQIIRASSTTYKTHRLPRGAASFKSLYLKRPSRAPRFNHLS